MKTLSIMLCLVIQPGAGAWAQAEETVVSTAAKSYARPETPNLIFQAPRRSPSSEEESREATQRQLRAVRLTGGAAAGAGLGLMGYALAAELAGPVGWAAALIFFGGLAAYLAHRRLANPETPPKIVPLSAPTPAPEATPLPSPQASPTETSGRAGG